MPTEYYIPPATPPLAGRVKSLAVRLIRATSQPLLLIKSDLRRKRQQQQSRRVVNDYFSRPGPKYLQIGCGRNLHTGWLNTDIYTDQGDVAYLDATQPFPLPDNAFDAVYCEHVIEHIGYDEGQVMLREALRVLRPGGRIRLATPDMARFLALYARQPTPEERTYMEWSMRQHTPQRAVNNMAAHTINTMFTSWGHRFLYDRHTLTEALASAGFVAVAQGSVGQSDYPHLRGLERHDQEIGEANNRFETLVMEAAKPSLTD